MVQRRNEALVIVDPLSVERRLIALGLTLQVLREALEAGIGAAALHSTVNYPRNYGGTSFWAEVTRWLRELLVPLGWHRDETGGQPSVVRGDNGIAIVVVRGNEATGDPMFLPTTQYKRGPVTIERVERNAFLPFDDEVPVETEAVEVDTSDVPTWLLLHYRKGEELMAELSFPISISKAGFVEEWGETVILPAIPLDPRNMPMLDDEPVNPDVNVRRRA